MPSAPLRYDAHNHLQDPRLDDIRADWLPGAAVAGLVVNGTGEHDWPAVLDLAARDARVVSSLGLHPWRVDQASPGWRDTLVRLLDAHPGAAVGEIGLDRWMPNPDLPAQEAAFLFQLRLAADRNLPASIHCLRHWGRMLELLRAEPRPARGFLLHSYGGPAEMVPAFAALGACFSLSAHFFRPGREAKLEPFRRVPPDRLLIETDAPDMAGPPQMQTFPLSPDTEGRERNHPGNLPAVYTAAADFLRIPEPTLTATVAANWHRLFAADRLS